MAQLTPLLEITQIDLECDQLQERHAMMPEREALRQSRETRSAFARERSGIASRRDDLSGQEAGLGTEVAAVAAKAAEVEETLYSGKVKVAKELEAFQEEFRLLKARQNELEEQEMELLEALEAVDGEDTGLIASDRDVETQQRSLEEQIAANEAEIAEAIGRLEARRADLLPGIPPAISTKYEALRKSRHLGGRAAAALGKGICDGCRVKLPILEYNRMLAEPPDALVQCSGCQRILVRTQPS